MHAVECVIQQETFSVCYKLYLVSSNYQENNTFDNKVSYPCLPGLTVICTTDYL